MIGPTLFSSVYHHGDETLAVIEGPDGSCAGIRYPTVLKTASGEVSCLVHDLGVGPVGEGDEIIIVDCGKGSERLYRFDAAGRPGLAFLVTTEGPIMIDEITAASVTKNDRHLIASALQCYRACYQSLVRDPSTFEVHPLYLDLKSEAT